jgi:CRISPR-associated protein Cmr3
VTTVSIESLDLLMFRDGKPFSAGDDHLARSIFPPHPITVAGFLRAMLVEAAGSLEEAARRFGPIGDSDSYGDFRLTRLLLSKDGAFFVPAPADLVVPKRSSQASPGLLRPLRELPFRTSTNMPDSNLAVLWPSLPDIVEGARGFVAVADLHRYLIEAQPPPKVYPERCFTLHEPRTQVGIDAARRTAAERQLYTVDYLRLLEGVSIIASFEGIKWPLQGGVARMGGEGRLVRFRETLRPQSCDTEAVARAIAARRRFKLVLLTPAIFQPGWRPGERLSSLLEAAGVSARLVGAAVNRSLPIGGFDLRSRRPKPMRLAAPAGSVYFYEIQDGDPYRLVPQCNLAPVSDEHWQAGMGIAALGTWDYAELEAQ